MVGLEMSGTIKFANITDGTSDLLCPRCKGFNLRQETVTIFQRVEDAETLTKITVDGSNFEAKVVPADGSGNPSNRRHGMVIQFSCENCCIDSKDGVIELTIAQHKGATEVGWQYTPI